ncbi:MAG: hypothetical protein IPJ36_11845 [Simplicispira sp.]|nr:hypothetical protein [Simplicispira sp.]
MGVFLPMGRWLTIFKLQPLPHPLLWLAESLPSSSYATLTTALKRFYIRRFGWR